MEENTLKSTLDSKGTQLTTLAGQNIKKYTHRWVQVDHGLNEQGDYIWHISQHRRERPFPDNLNLFWKIIANHIDKVIPDDIKVKMDNPPSDWEIKVMSVRALGIGKNWNFDEDDMEKPLEAMCDHLSDEIDKKNPRKKRL